MSRGLLAPAVVAILAVAAAPAFAANGVTPISPKQGDAVPAGKRPTFKGLDDCKAEGPVVKFKVA